MNTCREDANLPIVCRNNPNRPAVRRSWFSVVGALLLLLGQAASSPAYEEITVTGGGRVTGRVVLNGPPPPSRIFHLVFSPDIDFCSRVSDGKGNRLLKEFTVSDAGGLQDTIVAVVGVERGKPFSYTPRLEVNTCRISPFVMPVRNGHPMTIVNQDPVVHDIQAYTLQDDYTFAMFDRRMVPESVAQKEVRLRKGHYLFRTQCGVHDFMQSWGIAVGNPYFAVTDADGRYTIPDLPPGEYDIIAWHPLMKIRAGHVTVTAGGTARQDFQFDAGEVKIPLHDLESHYRFQPALLPDHLVTQPAELQRP
jgi:Carboxypeptidase regulatory-like domain